MDPVTLTIAASAVGSATAAVLDANVSGSEVPNYGELRLITKGLITANYNLRRERVGERGAQRDEGDGGDRVGETHHAAEQRGVVAYMPQATSYKRQLARHDLEKLVKSLSKM